MTIMNAKLSTLYNQPMPTIVQTQQHVAIVDSELLHTYLKAATSNNTRKAYRADIRHFMNSDHLLPAAPEAILSYLHKFADKLNPRTLQRRITALKNWHVYQGFDDPTTHPLVGKTLTGIYHTHGKPKIKAPALTLEQLTQIVIYLEAKGDLAAFRDSALLQIGFFGAFRRSELVAIQLEEIQFVQEGLEIEIPRSKTDQSGEGEVCAIPYAKENSLCPVNALKKWQEKSGLTSGSMFRRITSSNLIGKKGLSDASVNLIIKKHAIACKLPNAESYSGHSLRRGFATAATRLGAPFGSTMKQGRWRDPATVQEYIEEGERFEDNAAKFLLHRAEMKNR